MTNGKKIIIIALGVLLLISVSVWAGDRVRASKHARTLIEYEDRIEQLEESGERKSRELESLRSAIDINRGVIIARTSLISDRERELQNYRDILSKLISGESSGTETISRLENIYIEIGRRISNSSEEVKKK